MRTKYLDQWDYQLIDGCKSLKFNLDDAKKIWSERNACDPEDVDVTWLLSNMMDIVLLTNPKEDIFQMVLDAAPGNQWKFVCGGRKSDEYNYTDAWFKIMTSRIALTMVKDIPGYREWIDSQKTNAGIAAI